MAIWRKVRLGALAAACLAGAAVACRQLVGIGDDPPRADTTACGLSYATSDCASCVASNCCDETSACGSSATCSAYETCLGACAGEATCRAQCELDHPPGTRGEVPLLDACLATKCASVCNLGCGSVAESFTPPDAAPSCESCIVASACDLERACAGSTDCEQYVRCTNACTTFGCQQSCGPDAGSSTFAALGGVISGSCAKACAYGANWLCVGHVSWPSPTGSTTTLTALVTDQFTSQAEPGALVAPCSVSVQSCEPLADAATTDNSGQATLEVPQAATLPNGFYLLVTPPPSADGGPGAFLTALTYLRSPLTEATKAIGAPVLTYDELQSFDGQFGLHLEAGTGSLRAQVFDCNLHKAPAATVTVTTAAGASLPVLYGIQPGATVTDVTGNASVGNVPPGLVQITVTPPGGGPPSSKAAVILRADAYTTVSMLPTP